MVNKAQLVGVAWEQLEAKWWGGGPPALGKVLFLVISYKLIRLEPTDASDLQWNFWLLLSCNKVCGNWDTLCQDWRLPLCPQYINH